MRKKVLIVSATYYVDFSKQLEMWAIKHLDNERIKNKIIQVPGVFEIPVIISKNIKKYDGFIALGCVIKGETPHFDFISQATTNAIMKLSIDHNKPVGNGIITCLTKEQADKRSMKKGGEAAKAVISVLSH
jgi:6,7-dimethyl-8-ribityllumazine synthase